MFECTLEGQDHVIQIERLGQIVVGTAAHGLDGGCRAAERGDDDHGQIGEGRPELGENFQAAPARHLEIQEHGIGHIAVDAGERFVAISRFERLVALGAQEQNEVAADGPIVVGHQDRGGSIHQCGSPLLAGAAPEG